MFDISSTTAVGCCVAITLLYVLSLYIWRHGSRLDRQDAETIRKRFVSVGISCVLSTVVIRLVWTGSELVLERDECMIPDFTHRSKNRFFHSSFSGILECSWISSTNDSITGWAVVFDKIDCVAIVVDDDLVRR
jgi:hypothetical protein